MNFAISTNKPAFYLHAGAMLAVMLVFRFIPPPQGLTAEGLAVIGIFFGILYGWLFIDVVWPSLLGLVLLVPALEPLFAVAPLSAGMVGAILGLAFGSMLVIQLLKLLRR